MKGPESVLNSIVDNAADIMECQRHFNEKMIEVLEKKPDNEDRIAILKATNIRIADAVALMRENKGGWV